MRGVKVLGVSALLLAALPWPMSLFFENEDLEHKRRYAALCVASAERSFRMDDAVYRLRLQRSSHVRSTKRPPQVPESDEPRLWRQAKYRDAAIMFITARLQGVSNAAIYYNEGNALFLADDLPDAILAYRRGLRLDPGHRRLQENLEYARNQVAYPTPETRPRAPAWPSTLPFPSPDLVLLLALCGYGLTCISLTRWRMVHRGLLRTVLLGGLSVALGLTAWLLLRQKLPDLERPLVVITRDKTPFRLGNGPSYFPPHPELPYLPRGLEARRLHQRGEWLQIELASGHVGWVPRENVVVDEVESLFTFRAHEKPRERETPHARAAFRERET